MAIAFTIAENKPNKNDYSSGVEVLLALDEYGDTLLYKDKMEQLMQLCIELQMSVEDYSIYTTKKGCLE